MTEAPPLPSRIALLPPEEARKIAAGEVVDRPAALVRELIDNALDAGASQVELEIRGGGVSLVSVSDDGEGMNREDLRLCTLTHATSKIRRLEDLERAETLGFRGEALSAAAAVARLEILSSTDGREAWLLEAGGGRSDIRLSPGRRVRGSSVRALGLYDLIPARKRFLKREGSESLVCRQVFLDKALAFPGVEFRFIQEGELKIVLPRSHSYRERFAAALFPGPEGALLHEISGEGPGFSAAIVLGGPELYRQDRQRQYIFANGRRIQDFALLQAFEYGLQGYFPSGSRPVGAVYLDIDPALADFNIHPAKREARFRDPAAIHHTISSTLREYCRHAFIQKKIDTQISANEDKGPAYDKSGLPFERAASLPPGPGLSSSGPLAMEALLDHPPSFPALGELREAPPSYAAPPLSSGECRYLGRLFNLFILIERGERLYIIDQHAAHERIIYNRCKEGPIARQELLVPLLFETEDPEEDAFLESISGDLARMGLVIAGSGGHWRVEALPDKWRAGDEETLAEIRGLKEAGQNFAEAWLASIACKSAVKDGDYLDGASALELARAALALPDPHCPHGRPIWKELSREELFRAVRRL